MMYDIAVIHAQIVGETSIYSGNIYIKDGLFAAITDETQPLYEAKEIIDAHSNYVFPGLVDTHSHLGDPGYGEVESAECATAAAAVGGFTTCIDMPNNVPTILNSERFYKKTERLERECMVDYALYGALVKDNQKELKGLHDAGAIAFKSFLHCGGGDFTYPTMYEAKLALEEIKKFNGLAAFHCEETSINDGLLEKMKLEKLCTRQAFLDSRPVYSEVMASKNMIELARATGCRLQICHVSHPAVAKAISEARKEGVDVTGETCVHYLVFTENDLLEKGCLFKCAPPLRSQKASDELWSYVEDGTLTSVASDHSAGLPEQRDDSLHPIYELGNGISGIQTVLQSFYNKAVHIRKNSPSLITRCMSAEPARRFGLYGIKGAIKPGFDADLVILDPDKTWEVTAKSLYYLQKISAFVGTKGRGLPVLTMLRGKVIAKDYKPCCQQGYARFLRALP
ncbi:MAG: allantoinase AllB [Lachnospiraceae bacterium]|nr:allantoinase AllB [Lachnospiraceae bacterium]